MSDIIGVWVGDAHLGVPLCAAQVDDDGVVMVGGFVEGLEGRGFGLGDLLDGLISLDCGLGDLSARRETLRGWGAPSGSWPCAFLCSGRL
jgi:hypothetical protein